MGCGASAKPKYEAPKEAPANASETAAATSEPSKTPSEPSKTADKGTTSAEAAHEKSGTTSTISDRPSACKRRPSWDENAVIFNENKSLSRDSLDKTEGGTPMQRRSKVQTSMEMWWIDAIPAMYGVSDSEDLREELQEDAQADMVQQVVAAKKEDVRDILMKWLHDCSNEESREAFIVKVLKEHETIQLASPKKNVNFNVTEGQSGHRIQRKGTGFVTGAQVRALQCADFGDEDSGEESDEDGKDDEEFERQLQEMHEKKAQSQQQRGAVSSEAHEVDENWTPPVYEKTDDQHRRIADAVSESFMFAALGYDQLQPVIQAFEEVRIEAGVKVIEEGAEVGPNDRGLYVLEHGELDVFKSGNDGPVHTYNTMGQYFGDLALLYSCPRSATVVSTKPSVLWSIDRTTFNSLVKDGVQKAKERRMEFLSSVELLQHLNTESRSKINDVLRERTFGEGVHIIREGEPGAEFFILEKGGAAAIKEGVKVKTYAPSDWFGELALLRDEPRAADVITQEESTVLSLDRNAFHRLLGTLESLMQESAKGYSAGVV